MEFKLRFGDEEELVGFGGGGRAQVAVCPPVHVNGVHQAPPFDVASIDSQPSLLAGVCVLLCSGLNMPDTARIPSEGP